MADWEKIRRITSYSVLGISLVAFGVWFYYWPGGVQDANKLRDTFDRQKLEIASRELRKQELSDYLAAVTRQDDAAMELAARRYGLVGEHEYLWKVAPAPVEQVASN